jgi:hypothetical protein
MRFYVRGVDVVTLSGRRPAAGNGSQAGECSPFGGLNRLQMRPFACVNITFDMLAEPRPDLRPPQGINLNAIALPPALWLLGSKEARRHIVLLDLRR